MPYSKLHIKLIPYIIAALCGIGVFFAQSNAQTEPFSHTQKEQLQREVTTTKKFMDQLNAKIPDMLDKGIDSNKRSAEEGAALQVVAVGGAEGLEKLDVQSMAQALTTQSAGIKSFFKKQPNIKANLFMNLVLFVSNGPKKAQDAQVTKFYKEKSVCTKGVCTLMLITGLSILDENGQNVEMSDMATVELQKTVIAALEAANKHIKTVPGLKLNKTEGNTVLLRLAFGLNGLDAFDYVKSKGYPEIN